MKDCNPLKERRYKCHDKESTTRQLESGERSTA
jgi:hypothetical protein